MADTNLTTDFSHFEIKNTEGNVFRGSYHHNLGRGFVMYQDGREAEAFVTNADTSKWRHGSHKSLGKFSTVETALTELVKWIHE